MEAGVSRAASDLTSWLLALAWWSRPSRTQRDELKPRSWTAVEKRCT